MTEHRSGFAAFVGRPNVGKSTLMNALVGEKVAIMSSRPQTTRRAIRGIITRDDAQLIIVDTPGLHRPRTLLGERLNDVVRETFAEVDVIGFCLPADEKIGPGDAWIARELAQAKAPVVAIVTKVDKVSRDRVAEHLMKVSELGEFIDLVPVSSVEGIQVDVLTDVLIKHLPKGAALYPTGEVTDEPEDVMIAELIREAALEGVHDELPHSIAVIVEEMEERPQAEDDPRRPLLIIRAQLYVERDSQKGIIIGHGGERLKAVGAEARAGIERLLGRKVYLDLHIKIAKEWQRDPKQLGRMGF
ncbi:GTPase Era [Demequina lutea]|uniref:GTPase Era n=1 Tax=Demequina lutea TaxID=431489 RepID=A0A7Z0CJN1_9MICO|nr:GTPase Era [Demequina lutea]NYI41068.1 GTP-binding protein Era [Demequina lutea]